MPRRVTWSPSRRDLAIGLLLHLWIPAAAADSPAASDLQALLDASPGRIIEVPPGEHRLDRAPILFDHGQEPTDPPLRDVIISGNVVMNDGAGGMADGGGPRYRWAVFISSGRPHSPRNLLFQGNRFAPGTDGVSNTPLEPAPPKPATAP